MRALSGLALSTVFALLGAAVWVGLSRVWDIGLLVILACVVGGLAGYGMALGSKARGGAGFGLLAALVCLVACLSAKGAIAWFRASDFVTEYATVTDEDAYDNLCDETFFAMLEKGQISEGDFEDDYPAVVYHNADEQWTAMSDQERQDYKAAMTSQWEVEQGDLTGVASIFAFLFSWTLLDIFCVCSAIGTSFKIGSFRKPEEEAIPAWAFGTPTATAQQNPGQTAAPAAGPIAGPLAMPAPTAPTAPAVAPARTRPAATAATATPEDAASSFWMRLGTEPPARNTPSMKRTPAPEPTSSPTATDAPGPGRAEAA